MKRWVEFTAATEIQQQSRDEEEIQQNQKFLENSELFSEKNI